MASHWLTVGYGDISIMLSLALILLWCWLCGLSLRARLAQGAFSLSGHLRPRPDQATELALRAAFTELDQELAAVLGDPPVAAPLP